MPAEMTAPAVAATEVSRLTKGYAVRSLCGRHKRRRQPDSEKTKDHDQGGPAGWLRLCVPGNGLQTRAASPDPFLSP